MAPSSTTARLFLNERMDEPVEMPFLEGTACVFSTPSPLKSGKNEDCAGLVQIDDRRGLLVVADGVGGMPGGEDASHQAIRALRERVANGPDSWPLREKILQGFEQACAQVAARGNHAATTLAAVEVLPRGLRTYHVGDSDILVAYRDGVLGWKTLPHSPVGYGVEAGLLDPKEAIFHEARHLVSNVIGNAPMSIELSSTIPFAAGDTVLLASDGLLDNLHLEEAVAKMLQPDLLAATSSLVDLAAQRMRAAEQGPCKPDDLTLVLYRP
jgi:serine/threonine protein phosphatase PrpC